jgi:hypothetical protein
MLGSIFSFAQRQGIRTDNPCRGVENYPDGASEQFLNPTEIVILGAVHSKTESEGANISDINIIRLLAMKGAG